MFAVIETFNYSFIYKIPYAIGFLNDFYCTVFYRKVVFIDLKFKYFQPIIENAPISNIQKSLLNPSKGIKIILKCPVNVHCTNGQEDFRN